MPGSVGVVAIDHCGFSVASLDDAVGFWTEAMGFRLERKSEMGGDFLREVTGVADPRCRTAILVAPDGFKIELLEYSTAVSLGHAPESAGAIGATHLAVTVVDIGSAVSRIEAAGWRTKGNPQPIPGGPRAGTLVAYVSGPEGITIELMQPPA